MVFSATDDFTPNDQVDVAKARHQHWADKDPFPDIPPALLGSDAMLEYVRVTAMVHPFRGWALNAATGNMEPDRSLVKPASYEIRPGKVFYVFDEKGELRRTDLGAGSETRLIRLPRNSITFVSTEETLRLPLYIAARFNLRIKHVHRGILLGTGPLIDPGYNLPILIPLHNLTDQDYFISVDEGLIWVEFTKAYPFPTSPGWNLHGGPKLPKNTSKSFEGFLVAASGGTPIRSSIDEAVTNARRFAADAEAKVAGFGQKLNAIGVVGIVALVITVASLLLPTLDLVRSSDETVQSTRNEIAELRREVERLKAERGSDKLRDANAPGRDR